MEKESHEENNNYTVSGDVITKRKPGRPRKHLKLDSPEQSSRHIEDNDEAMVGQHVTGVIEATFEAGFLLSVKLGNSDTVLRGVLFKPGRCEPVSVDNDIAPHVPMITRNSDVVVQHQHHGLPAKRGRKSRFREKRGTSALAPVPILPALVPAVQNGGGSALPSHQGHDSQVSGGSNSKPFETLLTRVMKEGQVHNTASQLTEPESEEQALSIEPLQAIHPVHPVHIPKPMPSYGRGKMTELLQENVRETHFSQGE
ncbi:protein METABOLIC NETWORK MODULATOR 1 isoform X2 [Raphanus sativus]|uniref:Protein METABOLIC NETWORK MODULATOR 1 isoform X2 n=1 Tax=Raphanus sativus TaxID=3726 RepID=A0A6J0L933_RAPSA|nr:protein METABOLIC NETWORK MODULATOR 1 isoform X2 [Raphanus sativus]